MGLVDPVPTADEAAVDGQTELQTVTLAPRFWVPLAVLAMGWLLTLLSLLVASVVILLGLFLLIQSLRLRFLFSPEAFELHNGTRMLRRFPYDEWRGWRLLWVPLPVLLYFREVGGTHFVPVLFDAIALQEQLKRRLPKDVAASSVQPS